MNYFEFEISFAPTFFWPDNYSPWSTRKKKNEFFLLVMKRYPNSDSSDQIQIGNS